MKIVNLGLAVLFAIYGGAVLASEHDAATQLTHVQAERIMKRVTHASPYAGSSYEEIPNDGADKNYFLFEMVTGGGRPGDSVVLEMIGVNRRSGRLIVVRGEYCYRYPIQDNDKVLVPGKEGELPAICEAPDNN